MSLRWYAFLCGFGSDVLFTINHLRSISFFCQNAHHNWLTKEYISNWFLVLPHSVEIICDVPRQNRTLLCCPPQEKRSICIFDEMRKKQFWCFCKASEKRTVYKSHCTEFMLVYPCIHHAINNFRFVYYFLYFYRQNNFR